MTQRNTADPIDQAPAASPSARGELYPWSTLHVRMGWSSRATAEAQRKGLRVLAFAKRKYVLGSDLIAFLTASSRFTIIPKSPRTAGKPRRRQPSVARGVVRGPRMTPGFTMVDNDGVIDRLPEIDGPRLEGLSGPPARRANGAAECRPSQATIASDTGLQPRAVAMPYPG